MQLLTRYLLVTLLTAGIPGLCHSQEDPTNRQYLFNLMNVNPAYAGTRGTLSMTTGFRKQWAGIPGAPRTGVFSIDGPLNKHHLGLGLQLYDHTLGIEHTTGANLSFSTILTFEEDNFLSMGLQGGIMNYRIDRTSVPLMFQNDPAFQNNTNVMMPTAGIGFYYQRPGFYASLSAPSLLLGSVNQNNILSVSSPTLKNMQVVFTTGVTGQLGEQFQVKPSVYLKWMNGQVFEIHLNASMWVADVVGLGASYRADDAVLGILELKINDKLSFGYTYGKNIGNKSVLPQASHEAVIRLDLWRSDE